ncbi:MAG: hypothetical protein ACRDV7_07335 [Acidimicrobiia bacterium]
MIEDVIAARVFTEPRPDGEGVVMVASVHGRVGDRLATRGRRIAVITADFDGVRVRPAFGAARVGVSALAAGAIAMWYAKRWSQGR